MKKIKIHEQIQKLRKQRGLSQSDLGELIDMSQQAIASYECGTREPNVESLLKLAGAFKISLDQLFGQKPIPPIEPEEKINKPLQKRIEVIKKMSPEKQKTLMLFVDSLASS